MNDQPNDAQRPSLPAVVRGALAGAAGTIALDVTTYADMAVRGRASSGMPAKIVLELAKRWNIQSLLDQGDDDAKKSAASRRDAIGALLGYLNGLALPVAYALVRRRAGRVSGIVLGLGAMAASDVPAVALGVTDPAEWGIDGWISDLVPHLVYGLVAASVYDALSGGG